MSRSADFRLGNLFKPLEYEVDINMGKDLRVTPYPSNPNDRPVGAKDQN
jgi:hypothetical protein